MHSLNFSLYLLLCRSFGNRCCYLWNDFCSPLDVAATNNSLVESLGSN